MKIALTLLISIAFSIEVSAQCWQLFDMNHSEHSLLIRHDGTLWGQGRNNNGSIGDSSVVNRYSYVQIGSDSDWVSVYVGRLHSTAIKSDGTVWTWGANGYGTYGDGTSVSYSYPKHSHMLDDWRQFYPGSNQNFVLKLDGTIWAWGNNEEGELGDGTSDPHFAPHQIGTNNTWRYLAPGFHHVHGIQRDGTLWGWGQNGWNSHGALGDATFFDYEFRPRQVGTDTDWHSVAGGLWFSVALKIDGSLWTTGINDLGQLGDGSAQTGRRNFVQIGTDKWKKVTAGRHHVVALKRDGTLWAWGLNGDGQLGNGTFDSAVKPVQIGTSNEWVDVQTGQHYSIAQKSDGSLWTWGANNSSEFARVNTPQKIQCNDPNYVAPAKLTPPIEIITNIFPNPVHTTLYITSNTDSPIEQVVVVSATGQVVFEESVNTNELNLEFLSRGTYIIQIFQKEKISQHKFIKL